MHARYFSFLFHRRSGAQDGFGRATGGASAVEFAFILPIAIYLFIGTFDFGLGIYRQMEVKQAAQVGAGYAIAHPSPFDSSAISQAVSHSSSFSGVSASPAPTSYCGCVANSALAQASCGTTCSDGTQAGTYVTVYSSATYTTALPYPYVPNNFSLSGKATVRLQ